MVNHPNESEHQVVSDIVFLAGTIPLFAGGEAHAVHANEMNNPQRQFLVAMLVASVVIILPYGNDWKPAASRRLRRRGEEILSQCGVVPLLRTARAPHVE
jgi:hypothetical protein